MSKTALITGINGMDGSHLADFLLGLGYTVYGMRRPGSPEYSPNTEHLLYDIQYVDGDLTDQRSIMKCLEESEPDEVYNLASQSSVAESWKTPEITSNVTGLGVVRMLEAVRKYDKLYGVKFYQASSSEMFGEVPTNVANENTPFNPTNPYGAAKLFGHCIAKNYRESYGRYFCSGILFNHESERRSVNFVTRKISSQIARIYAGEIDHISLGNIESKRDWGYAPDYVESMWLTMQNDNPEDYVISTGQAKSIRDILDVAFKYIGIDSWENMVKTDLKYYRPTEVKTLVGDSSKAFRELGWAPKTSFEEFVQKMVKHDISKLSSYE